MNTIKLLIAAVSLLFTSLVWAQVNINSANAETLQSLNGIGKAKAEAIIKHRETHGPFRSLEELTEVKGIGDKMLEKIRAELIVE